MKRINLDSGIIKKISFTAFVEVAVKVIGLISGILIIRLLPVEEYALYTLGNTMLGTMLQLSDGGLSMGVMSIGGKHFKDKNQFSTIMNTALTLRRKFGIICYIALAPVVYFLMINNGASPLSAVLICLSIIPMFYAQLSYSLNQVPFKLYQDLVPLQKNNLKFNFSRLIFTIVPLFIFPFASIAILSTGVAQYLADLRLKKLSGKFFNLVESSDADTKAELLSITKRILPTAIYFSLSGQLTVWLVSIFGSVKSVAEIGALSRLSLVFSVFTSIFSLIVVPRFARLPNEKAVLVKWFVQIQVVLFLIAFLIPLFISFFPDQILMILGSNYSGLSRELVILGFSTGLNLIISGLAGLNSSRAYILHPGIQIPFNVAVLVASIIFITPDTTENALWVGVARASVAPILMNFVFFYYMNKSIKNEK